MTEPKSCSACFFWSRHRSDSNWGRCDKIGPISKALAGQSKAYVYVPKEQVESEPVLTAQFHTRDTFDCGEWEQK